MKLKFEQWQGRIENVSMVAFFEKTIQKRSRHYYDKKNEIDCKNLILKSWKLM